MASETIVDNELGTLKFHTDTKIIHHCFHKFVHGEDLRAILLAGVEHMKTHGACKWLSDDRKNTVVSAEDRKWSQEVWFPKAKNAGWKHWAILQPEKIMAEINMKEFLALWSKLGINAKMFTDPDEAMAWLIEQ